jgi:hypothetical protein
MLHKTLAIDPNHHNALVLLAHAARATGNTFNAIKLFDRALRLKRGVPLNEMEKTECFTVPPVYNRGDMAFCATSIHKLKHDAEQLRYLITHELISDSYEKVAREYDLIRTEIANTKNSKTVIHFTEDQIRRIGNTYNMFLYNTPTPAITPRHAVNFSCDTREIEDEYHNNACRIALIDDFLTGEALEKLTRFCLESTIWYNYTYRNGYVGATIEDGFSCGMLLQIAEELRQLLPSILLDHPLMYCWGYKYDTMHEGIKLHADNAAVNVNFWITPDEANLDKNSGGLTVYKEEAPLDWLSDEYNKNPALIRKYLDERNSDSVHIPYRQNRAMVFHSNLFHEADRLHFKEGYENRRINITMLFGRRGG